MTDPLFLITRDGSWSMNNQQALEDWSTTVSFQSYMPFTFFAQGIAANGTDEVCKRNWNSGATTAPIILPWDTAPVAILSVLDGAPGGSLKWHVFGNGGYIGTDEMIVSAQQQAAAFPAANAVIGANTLIDVRYTTSGFPGGINGEVTLILVKI